VRDEKVGGFSVERSRTAVINRDYDVGSGVRIPKGNEYRLSRPERARVLDNGDLLVGTGHAMDVVVPQDHYHVREEIREVRGNGREGV
jgi:hypothetical protein